MTTSPDVRRAPAEDASAIVDLARRYFEVPYDDVDSLCEYVSEKEYRLLPTLLGALGDIVPDEASWPLLHARRRHATMLELTEKVRTVAAGAAPLKGAALATLYPDEAPRWQNDLDLWVDDDEQFWRVVRMLYDDGWSAIGFAIRMVEGRLVYLVELEHPPDHPFAPPRWLEMTTLAWAGNGYGMPPLLEPPLPLADGDITAHLLYALADCWDGEPKLRDLLDFHFAAHGAPPEPARLAAALGAHDMWPDYNDLHDRMRRAGLDHGWLPAPDRRGAREARARRALRSARLAAAFRPGRPTLLQSAYIYHRGFPLVRRSWGVLGGRADVQQALDAGMWVYGMQIDDHDAGTGLLPRLRPPLLDSVVGRWLLTCTDAVSQEEYDAAVRMAGDAPARSTET